MNFQSVLIVTYGRSGSTLLQGLLNSIDGCVVRGENHNMVYRLYQAYAALLRSQEEVVKAKSDGASPTNPWFGATMLDDKAFVADVAAIVRRQLLGGLDPATGRSAAGPAAPPTSRGSSRPRASARSPRCP